MAIFSVTKFEDCYLSLNSVEKENFNVNHILEPEFHQDIYKGASEKARLSEGAFILGDLDYLVRSPNRGIQPKYSDDDNDPSSVRYIGMINEMGFPLTESDTDNICALKSISIRNGYVDFGTARCVSREFYDSKPNAKIKKNDLLINSTGDGTIGRVAIYNADHSAMVDGHITIVRFKNSVLARYVAAYLMSNEGKNQIYRYINGSSGQVEIYPQDIERLWIPGCEIEKMEEIASCYQRALNKYEDFQLDIIKTRSCFIF